MTAIITSKFRLQATDLLKDRISDGNHYMFLGRSQPWDNESITAEGVDTTVVESTEDSHQVTHYEAYNNMQIIKKIPTGHTEFVGDRIIWTPNTVYVAWDSKYDESSAGVPQNHVVVGRNVFLCLYAPPSPLASSVQPAIPTTITDPVTGTDKYIWKYLYTISDDLNAKFTTEDFIPVPYQKTDPAGGSSYLVDQWNVQDNADNGKIRSIIIDNPGVDYLTKPAVQLVGNGNSDTATSILDIPAAQIIMDGNSISEITMHGLDGNGVPIIDGTNVDPGDVWTQVTVVIGAPDGTTNPTQATAHAVLPPVGGFGANAQVDLSAHNLAINTKFELLTSALADNFREIGIVHNVLNESDGSAFTGDESTVLRSMVLNDTAAAIFNGGSMTMTQGSASAFIDKIDLTTSGADDIIHYHQDNSTGFTEFVPGAIESLDGSGAVVSTSFTALSEPAVARYSGDIIYFEKRKKVARASDQIENIKLVVEL